MLIAFVMLGMAAAGNGWGQRLRRAPRDVRVVALQQAQDSLQVEVAWTAPQQGAGAVTGYTLRVSAPGWLIERTTAGLADTLWLPKDTVIVSANVCVNAFGVNVVGPPACVAFEIPAKIVIGPPGVPTVKPVGGLAALVDSVLVVVQRTSPADTVQDAKLYLVGWMNGPAGSPLSVMCSEQPSGEIGWGQVELIGHAGDFAADVRPVAGGGFLADDCGWDAAGVDDAALATIARLILGPVPFLQATIVLEATFALDLTHYDVLVTVRERLSANAYAGGVVTITPLSGAWGNGSTDARTCTSITDGTCGPGRVTPGARLRLDAPGAVPVEFTAPAAAPNGQIT
jgi:hypothetical protein